MEVHFSPELQEKVDRVAAENRRGADEYVQQLVESYVDHDAWFMQKITHEEVGTWLQDISCWPK